MDVSGRAASLKFAKFASL